MTTLFYKRSPLRFQCTGCGKCCTGNSSHYVELSVDEAQHIRQMLGVSEQWFRRHYLVKLFDDRQGLRITEKGRCILLDQNGMCRVYEARPAQCKSYPWWPELVSQESAWKREARRCEGIGRGDVIPVEVIEQNLKSASDE